MKDKEEVLQEIFDNKNQKQKMIWDVYDYYMHPILGYRWKQPSINPRGNRNDNELNSY
tara:strand:- start:80 stop:253 length:174 start_codon:yes stop_codon:yes gene_type:complete